MGRRRRVGQVRVASGGGPGGRGTWGRAKHAARHLPRAGLQPGRQGVPQAPTLHFHPHSGIPGGTRGATPSSSQPARADSPTGAPACRPAALQPPSPPPRLAPGPDDQAQTACGLRGLEKQGARAGEGAPAPPRRARGPGPGLSRSRAAGRTVSLSYPLQNPP